MKLLFIIKRPPTDQLKAKDSLDAILTCSVFEQHVGLLFLGDGVLQLTPDQGNHELREQLELLSLYGVRDIYVHHESLVSRQLDCGSLILSPESINNAEAGRLIAAHDTVFHF